MDFIGTLKVEQVSEATDQSEATWRVLAPFGVRSAIYSPLEIIVPADFVTDFASVPRVPIAYELCGNIAQDCATGHDYMYSTGCVSRLLADALLLEWMEAKGFDPVRSNSIYLAVRAFGAPHYIATGESSL